MNIKYLLSGAVAAINFLSFNATIIAADLPPPITQVTPNVIESYQPFQLRVRATYILPDGRTHLYDQYGTILPLVKLSGGPGSDIYGSGARVGDNVIPEFDLSYYFTKNIALETICCVSRHRLRGKGSLANLDIGNTWVFPPTLLVQYHFTNFGAFQPYIGVGANFTAFFGERSGNTNSTFVTPLGIVGANQVTRVSLSSSWGMVGQLGFDYMMNEHWGFNLDAKRVMMQPKIYANVWNDVVSPLLGPIPVRGKANIDPWMISVGVTYRFGGGDAKPVVARY